MAAESYKKWIVIGIFAMVAVILLFAIMQSDYRRETTVQETREKPAAPPGPLMDRGLKKTVPVEELGADLSNPVSLAALGDKYFEKADYDQAVEIYRKVLEMKPDDVDTYNDLGLAYNYTGKPDLAIDILKKGIDVDPSYQRIWLSLGFVQMSAGNKEEADSALAKAAELDPQTDVGREALRMRGLLK